MRASFHSRSNSSPKGSVPAVPERDHCRARGLFVYTCDEGSHTVVQIHRELLHSIRYIAALAYPRHSGSPRPTVGLISDNSELFAVLDTSNCVLRFSLGQCDSPFDWLVSDQFLDLGRLKGGQIHLEQDHNQLICSWMSGKVIQRQAFGLTSNATDFSPTINNWKSMSRRSFRSIANAAQIASLQDSVRYALNCIELHGEFPFNSRDGWQAVVRCRPNHLAVVGAALDTCATDSPIQLVSFSSTGRIGCDEQWVGMRFGQCKLNGLRTEKAEVYIRQNPTYALSRHSPVAARHIQTSDLPDP